VRRRWNTSGSDFPQRIAAGEWVVDLRGRRALAAGHLPGSYGFELSDFAGLAAARPAGSLTVLDVRQRTEWAAGHIGGAVHVPLHELADNAVGLPDAPVWLHCQAGYRASIAASILHAGGREVTAIDDSFDAAERAGLTITAP
jgi:hydroxyacylglutathione hydrolase